MSVCRVSARFDQANSDGGRTGNRVDEWHIFPIFPRLKEVKVKEVVVVDPRKK